MSGGGFEKVVLITGATRGIGLELAQMVVARQPQTQVLLGARRGPQGEAAVQQAVRHDGGVTSRRLRVLELDVCDGASVERAAALVQAEYGGLDVLVNNAGVMSHDELSAAVAEETLRTNYFGLVHVTRTFLPLLRPGGIVVQVSSGMGQLTSEYGDAVREMLTRPTLTEPELDAAMHRFVRDVASHVSAREGWRQSAYSVSKAAVNAHVRLLARELAEPGRTPLRVVAICPGWCQTDMGGSSATRTPQQGAESIYWAIALPPRAPVSGGFFRDGQPMEF